MRSYCIYCWDLKYSSYYKLQCRLPCLGHSPLSRFHFGLVTRFPTAFICLWLPSHVGNLHGGPLGTHVSHTRSGHTCNILSRNMWLHRLLMKVKWQYLTWNVATGYNFRTTKVVKPKYQPNLCHMCKQMNVKYGHKVWIMLLLGQNELIHLFPLSTYTNELPLQWPTLNVFK